jgi:hypothetical protein
MLVVEASIYLRAHPEMRVLVDGLRNWACTDECRVLGEIIAKVA